MRKWLTVSLAMALLFSCKEKTNVNLINGVLYDDCNTIIPNREIALKANQGGNFTNPIILGSAISNADGSFDFTYELEEESIGTGNILLVNEIGFETLLQGIELNEDFTINLYREDVGELEVVLSGTRTLNPSDTFFYATTQSTTTRFIVQPNYATLDTLSIKLVNQNKDAQVTEFYYGIGINHFNDARNAAFDEERRFQNIQFSLNGCGDFQTANVVLN